MRSPHLLARSATVSIAAVATLALIAAARPALAEPPEPPSPPPASQSAPANDGPFAHLLDAPNQWLTNALSSALVSLGQGVLDALHKDVDWAFGSDGQGAG